tara:strand:+ start:4467 stop:5081 length:615 start_codon:yes stop_codon:yes gene_type:complete
MNKRGQFFLLAAIIIVAIVISLALVYNRARAPEEDISIFDLSDEIDFEASQVIDSGVFNIQDETKIGENIENITDYYAKQNQGTDIITIYGNANQITAVLYKNTEVGSVSIATSGDPINLDTITEIKKSKDFQATEGEVTIELDGTPRSFNLKKGQNFYIVLKKPRGQEQFVAAPEAEDESDATGSTTTNVNNDKEDEGDEDED